MVNCSMADCATRRQRFSQPHLGCGEHTDLDGLLLHLLALLHMLDRDRKANWVVRTMSADLI
jgi:hypothetical protein